MAFRTEFRFRPYKDESGTFRGHPAAERIYGPIFHVGALVVPAYVVETGSCYSNFI